jgi:hypothetical protein
MMPLLLAAAAENSGILGERLHWLATGARDGLVETALALLVLVVGWAAARAAGLAMTAGLRALRFNHRLRRLTGWRVLEHEVEASTVVTWAAFWGIMLLASLVSLDLLGIHVRAAVGVRLAEILPRILAAASVAVASVLVAMAAAAVIRSALRGAGRPRAELAAQVCGTVVLAFGGLMAFEQLGLAAQLLVGICLILVAALGLALGLAFGLGCRDLARDLLVEYLRLFRDELPARRTGTGRGWQ